MCCSFMEYAAALLEDVTKTEFVVVLPASAQAKQNVAQAVKCTGKIAEYCTDVPMPTRHMSLQVCVSTLAVHTDLGANLS